MMRNMIKVLLAIFACLGLLVGCGVGKETHNEAVEKQIEKLFKPTEEQVGDGIGDKVANKICKEAKIEVISSSNTECRVKVTSPDVYQLFFDVFNKSYLNKDIDKADYEDSTDELLATLYAQLNSGEYTTEEHEITLQIENGEVQTNEEFADALSGGLLKALNEISTMYLGG